jgi:hypothetical protein
MEAGLGEMNRALQYFKIKAACMVGRFWLVWLLCLVSCLVQAGDPPMVSVEDYLKAQGQESGFPSRKSLFIQRFGKQEEYVGSQTQNLRLLRSLVASDPDCKDSTSKCIAQLKKEQLPLTPRGTRTVQEFFPCPGYVLAEGLGVHGSYAVEVTAVVADGVISAKDFRISINSAAATLGSFAFSGSVKIYNGEDKVPAQQFLLEAAWFPTISAAESTTVYMYAAKGTEVKLPAGKAFSAEIEVHPTVATHSGIVPLWANTVRTSLQKP